MRLPALAIALLAGCAQPEGTITYDLGGPVYGYSVKYADWERRGVMARIVGYAALPARWCCATVRSATRRTRSSSFTASLIVGLMTPGPARLSSPPCLPVSSVGPKRPARSTAHRQYQFQAVIWPLSTGGNAREAV